MTTSAAARFLALTGARLPIVQAPMAGSGGVDLTVAAIGAGGVGSLPCAMLTAQAVMEQARAVQAEVQAEAGTGGPLNLNFFAHRPVPPPVDGRWEAALAPFYAREGVRADGPAPATRRPFDAAMAEAVEAVRPQIVSFHFGLPEAALLARVRGAGALIFGNATSVAEALWLERAGCDAIIAQGQEAGGHAGHFLDGHHPVGLATLLRGIGNAGVRVPVIAAGGIGDEAGVRAAMAAGAGAVQVGTAYLRTPQSGASAVHRAALATAGPEDLVFTTLFSGGVARGIRNRLIEALGPISDAAPPFPQASAALAPLCAAAERDGRGDYSPLWAGMGVRLAREEDAGDVTARLGCVALGG